MKLMRDLATNGRSSLRAILERTSGMDMHDYEIHPGRRPIKSHCAGCLGKRNGGRPVRLVPAGGLRGGRTYIL
jgi:hypothetical protein